MAIADCSTSLSGCPTRTDSTQPLRPLEVEAAAELANRAKPGWFSFCLGNIAVFFVEPSLAGNWIAILLTLVNLIVLALKGTLITRWSKLYETRPAASMWGFGVLSALQSANLSAGVACVVLTGGVHMYGFVALLVALACAQAVVVAQCTHIPILRACLIAYLVPAAIGALALGGLEGFCTSLLLVAELAFLLYQGAQMNRAYWQSLRENRELFLAREQADLASKSKSQFLAKVSHELRTPIHGVMGMTSLVLDSPINAEQRDNLETAHHSATSLLELVNHLLDLGKIEANRIELEHIPFHPIELVSMVVKPLRHAASAKGIELVFQPDAAVSGRLLGDPVRLKQILTNLTGNAVKFTSRGQVIVRARTKPVHKGSVLLEIDVEDTGIGIAPDKLERIFDPFRQADPSVNRQFGGTGLGLAIARNLAELMGGELTVTSTIGQGSSFRFACTFPEEGPGAPKLAVEPRRHVLQSSRPLSVLVADDNPVNRRLAEKQLTNWGHKVALAEDGAEAVELASTRNFDLILMDVLMPALDGFRATEQIRSMGIETPVVAVTANALEGQLQSCLDAGMNWVLPKPYTARQLFDTVEGIASGNAGENAPAPLPRA